MNNKKILYQKAIKIGLEQIHEGNGNNLVSIVGIINNEIKSTNLQLKYDCEFYPVLYHYLIELPKEDTLKNEDTLLQLILSAAKDNLLLKEESDFLRNQVDMLKSLRRIYEQTKQNPYEFINYLREQYDQFHEMDEQNLIDRHEKEKLELKLKIEDQVKSFPYSKYMKQSQIQPQQQAQQVFSTFDSYLENIYNEQVLKQDNLDRLMQEVEFIREIVSNMNLKKLLKLDYVTVQPYGSTVSGFSQKTSDVDVSINTNCYLPVEPFLKLLKNFIDNYCKQQRIEVETKIVIAKTPVLQYARRGQHQIELDISINNILGCVNSRMLQTLSEIDPNIKKLGIIIKTWAKSNKISSKDTLSSYSMILIMFSFLFKEKILNSYFLSERKRNEINKTFEVNIKREKHSVVEDFPTNLFYSSDTDQLRKKLLESEQKNQRKPLQSYSLSELFTKFIDFYYEDNGMSNQDRRKISIFEYDQYDKEKIKKNEYYFNIEDPFDVKHNPGERSNNKSDLYRNAFKNAKNYIESQQYDLLFPNN